MKADPRVIAHMYIVDELSTYQISKALEVSQTTVRYHLVKQNIPLRDHSSAQRTFMKKNPHQRVGKRHSEDGRERISASLRSSYERKKNSVLDDKE